MYCLDFVGTDIAQDVPYPDPIELMQKWLPPLDELRPVMALSTLGTDGYPNVRHVLASTVGPEGISFHVSENSAKVAELLATPKAGAAIVWPNQLKQLIVQGDVVRQPEQDAAKVYAERPAYLQHLAHINSSELAQKPAVERKAVWSSLDSAPPAAPPSTWAGFILKPTRISFWRGAKDTPSNRHDYWLVDGTWQSTVVAG